MDVDIDQRFRDGTLPQASDVELCSYMCDLCTKGIPNDMVHPRAILRGLAIQHVQMSRLIEKLNRKNTILTWLFVAVSICAVLSPFIAAWKH